MFYLPTVYLIKKIGLYPLYLLENISFFFDVLTINFKISLNTL